MKKYIFLLLYVIYQASVAQSCDIPVMGISTNPKSPVNIEHNGLNNTTDLRNNFDWTSPNLSPPYNYVFPKEQIELYGILGQYLPQTGGILLNPLKNGSTYLDFLHPNGTFMFAAEDGWELIHRGLGKLMAIDPASPTGEHYGDPNYLREVPYFILYNKYTGKLEVFGISTLLGYDLIQVNLKFGEQTPYGQKDKGSGLFGYYRETAQPLDEASIREVFSADVHPNLALQWFHAGFDIMYDPCVCGSKQYLQLSFIAVDNAKVSLTGSFVGNNIDGKLIDENGQNKISVDFLSAFDAANALNTANEVNLNGIISGKEVSSIFNELSQNAANNLEIQDAFEFLAKSAEFGVGIAEAAAGDEFGLIEALKIGASSLDFLSTGIQQNGGSTTFPSLIIGDMIVTGTVTDADKQLVSEIAVPHSMGSASYGENWAGLNSEPYYPLYNEALGTFAVLETPTINYLDLGVKTESQSGIDWNQVAIIPFFPFIVFYNGTWTHIEETREVTFRVNPTNLNGGGYLAYLYNPIMNIDETRSKIYASIVVEMDEDLVNWGVKSAINFQKTDIVKEDSNQIKWIRYQTPFVPVSCLGDFAASFTFWEDEYTFHSGLNGSGGYTGPYVHHSPFDPAKVKVKLKLIVDYVSVNHNQNGENFKHQQILTYPAKGYYMNYANQVGSYGNPTTFNGSEIKDNLTLTTQQLTQDVFAWNSVTIDGDISSVSGQSIRITAPDIKVISGGITPDITLVAADYPYSCGKAHQYKGDISAFCTSDNYHAAAIINNTPKKSAVNTRVNIIKELQIVNSPNPFSGFTELNYQLPTDAIVSITLSDLMGKTIRELQPEGQQESGSHTLTITGEGLTSGVYFVTIRTDKAVQTIKIVKE